jgi:hypothetical protein
LGTFLKVGGESDRGHPLALAVSEVTKGARVKSNEVCKRGIKELRVKETTEGANDDKGVKGLAEGPVPNWKTAGMALVENALIYFLSMFVTA